MDENLFILFNSLLNIFWGIAIFYSMNTGHCLNNSFWAFLGIFLILFGLLTFFYYFIFTVPSIEFLNEMVLKKLLILIKKYDL